MRVFKFERDGPSCRRSRQLSRISLLPPMSSCDWSSASVLVQVDDGMVSMLCNWLAHYRKLQLANPVYVVAHSRSQSLRAALAALEIPTSRILDSNASAASSRTSNFGGASFYALNAAKIWHANELLSRTSRPVIFSDVDTVWLRNPFTHLVTVLPPHKHFAIAPDANEALRESDVAHALAQRHHVCACFFAVCPAASWLLDAWWRAATPEKGGAAINEQKAFQALLNRRPQLVRGNGSSTLASGSGDGGSSSSSAGARAGTAVEGSGSGPIALLTPAAFPTGQHDPPIQPHAVWMVRRASSVSRPEPDHRPKCRLFPAFLHPAVPGQDDRVDVLLSLYHRCLARFAFSQHANWIQRRTRASTTTAKKNRLIKRGKWEARCNAMR